MSLEAHKKEMAVQAAKLAAMFASHPGALEAIEKRFSHTASQLTRYDHDKRLAAIGQLEVLEYLRGVTDE